MFRSNPINSERIKKLDINRLFHKSSPYGSIYCTTDWKLIKPKYPALVKKTLQITIPIDIYMNKLSRGAPSPIPSAAPRGAPKRRGDNNPKPIIPYLFLMS